MSNHINLEQIRAKNALSEIATKAARNKERKEGDNLSGYASLIINNGLIATIAFSIDKGGQHSRIADAIAYHLSDRNILAAKDAKSLRDAMCDSSSSTLQRATRETLAFLSYLKRFQHN